MMGDKLEQTTKRPDFKSRRRRRGLVCLHELCALVVIEYGN